ncbi:isochorismatase family protein [Halomonas sp. HK25]|uniref:isochorismatase family protein n=1 Tax=Halomonas sp. HK25 TaxID=3394321 RepID=UPI0039FC5247
MNDKSNLKSGFGGALAIGQRPALLVVDFQRGFTEPSLSPLASDCTEAIAATNQLIRAVRPHGPVIFTVCSYNPGLLDSGLWHKKCPTLETLAKGTAACELDPSIDSESKDLVIEKTQASAFFGTPVAGILTSMSIDTLYVAGCTTSGCIRASVVDALQHGFPPFVVEEACADRSKKQHDSNIIDMSDKYAEVLDLATALNQLHTYTKITE